MIQGQKEQKGQGGQRDHCRPPSSIVLHRLLLPAALLAAVWGCSGEASAGAEYTVRDSIGIEIVENVSGSWTDDTRWRLSSDPVVDIGVLEGAPEYQLFQVRDPRRLPDGRFVVGNANELRFYDADGTYLFTSGQQGSGPGEFEGLGILRPFPGDSLLAYDFQLTRASVFDANGEFGRSYQVIPPTEGGFGFAVGAFSDGTLIIKSPQIFQGGFEEGAQRRDEDHYTISSTGEFLDSAGTFPGPEQFIETARDGDNFMVSVTSPPFGRTTVLEVHGTQFCFGSSDTYEIRCFQQDGTLTRVVRRAVSNRTVTADDLESLKQQELADADDENSRRATERRFEEMPVAGTMPAYDGLAIDAAGNLWVREYAFIDGLERRWTVFDTSGRMLGDVTFPANFGVTQIGEDFVLGVWRDDLEVEHVRLYELIK